MCSRQVLTVLGVVVNFPVPRPNLPVLANFVPVNLTRELHEYRCGTAVSR